MAIIIEDGTIVAGANSYASEAELTAFAAERGATLTGAADVLLIKAMDYVESFRKAFQGSKVDAAQPLQWPRSGAYVDGYPIPTTEIPVDLKRAQMQAAIESDSTDLNPNTGQAVKREKVDVIEVEYESGGANQAPTFRKVDAYLEPLLSSGYSTITLGVMR